MSVQRYQSQLNRLDKEIASLEKKRAEEENKSASNDSKASKVAINKNASESSIRMKTRQICRYRDVANKARTKSAEYSKKIGEKRKRRNEIYLRLQKTETEERKKEERESNRIRQAYEQRIKKLESEVSPMNNLEQSQGQIEGVTEEYDVFISHAYEDKEDFVEEFVKELVSLDIDVWYDDIETDWGSSLREEIDRGLKLSKYGIVVLSPNYIAEGKYWTKQELNGLFQMESVQSGRILPIWHNLTKKEIFDYSPMISDRKAMTSANFTASEMAKELASLLNG